ncbi:HNH endonuclease [Mesorhizobium sp. B2-3-4]|nr:HNH endonuclease [Mesorhizobium sp. B2-3-4]
MEKIPGIMARIKTMAPAIRSIDTRAVKVAPKVADAELQSAEYRQWRNAVYRRAGYRCEAMDNGHRCTKAAPTHRMFADHIVERRDGGALLDAANGQCLCGSHHSRKTVAARAARLSFRTRGGGSNL